MTARATIVPGPPGSPDAIQGCGMHQSLPTQGLPRALRGPANEAASHGGGRLAPQSMRSSPTTCGAPLGENDGMHA